ASRTAASTPPLHDALPISRQARFSIDCHISSVGGRSNEWLSPELLRSNPTSSSPTSRCRLSTCRFEPGFSHSSAISRQKCLWGRSEEHTSELQSRENLVCR